MANNSFKIKNSLVLTPRDLSTLTNPEAGDIACDINDANKIKRYDTVTASWLEVGEGAAGSGGGVGGVDIFFVQDFESAKLTDFTQTGLTLSSSDPLKGSVSALLTHQAAVNQSLKQTIPVDRKFRGQAMVLRLDSKSNASAGNLVINIKDETNNANIVASEQLQLSNDVNGAKSSIGFVIPESCASLSYTITALPEAGSPVSRIDDIICELAETALLETVVELTGNAQTLTIPLTQSGLVQEGDSVLLAAGNAGQTITADVTNIPFTFLESRGDTFSFDGSVVTVLKTGVYAISGSVAFTASADHRIRLYVDGVANRSLSVEATASSSSRAFTTSIYLTEGQSFSIRSNQTGGTLSTNPLQHYLYISYQGSLKQVSVNPNSKITIPTSELRFEGASSRGSTATAIVKFDTLAKIRGDAFTVTNTAADGTYVTMTKAGKLDVSLALSVASSSDVYITKNQQTLTTFPTASESLSRQQITSSAAVNALSYSGYVQAGDIIRVCSTDTVSTSNFNAINLSFQEQEIAVSVSNTLPQFSESDSSVRLESANGYGSSNTLVRRFSNLSDNLGSDIAYNILNDEAINGASFTVRTSGIYHIAYSDSTTVSTDAARIHITKNSITGSSGVLAFSDDRLNTASNQQRVLSIAWSGYLSAGDVIRPVVAVAANVNGGAGASFTISKVGKPNVTGVDVTPFVNVPQPESQSAYKNSTAGAAVDFSSAVTSGSGLYSLSGTTLTALKSININASLSSAYQSIASGNTVSSTITLNGATVAFDSSFATAASQSIRASVNLSTKLVAGDILNFSTSATGTGSYGFSILATALSDAILTAPETFSTDTASLTYAGSGTYTLSTLANAPVGTYITFTYAANTNTRTQTTTRPTQTDADMNANGILLYTRAYNAPSSAAQPAAIAIQIGKGLKGVSHNLYKSIGKSIEGSTDAIQFNTGSLSGISYKAYNEVTGILYIDSGEQKATTSNTNFFSFSDLTTQSSGYLVINASKNPALTGLNTLSTRIPRIATLKDVKSNNTDAGNSVGGVWTTRQLNTLEDTSGIVKSLASNRFTLEPGTYYIEATVGTYEGGLMKARLLNTTSSTNAIIGSSERVTGSHTMRSHVLGELVLTSETSFELQSRIVTSTTGGLGLASNFGVNEVYSICKITKIK